MKTETCQICHKTFPLQDLIPAQLVRDAISDIAKEQHHDWDPKGYLCEDDMDKLRIEYISDILKQDQGEFSKIADEVIQTFEKEELIVQRLYSQYDKNLTSWDKLSDKIASFGGSWAFLGWFFFLMLSWMGLNTLTLFYKPFDPYPFIFLNLILSCLAAIQAPIIMMSQNRIETRDRLRAENDFKINLKSEIEIRSLHEKIDHLMYNQWKKLLEIQQIQTDLIQENLKHLQEYHDKK